MSVATRPKSFSVVNSNKADFNQLYVQPDPRMYYRILGGLGYIIAHLANPVFMQLIQARYQLKGGPITVLDLGCSYGVNGALMKYPVNWDMLYNRYRIADLEKMTSQQLEDYDRHYFQSWPKRRQIRVIGLDCAHNAVRYAERSGSVDRGFAADLENEDVSPELAAALENVDLVFSTGCVGYVTERTFEKIAHYLPSGSRIPWVASFVLRMFPYDAIDKCLASKGLMTERFDGATFVQRRFADREEMEGVLKHLHSAGVDTASKEDCGLYHAELFVSRPGDEIARRPINRMVSITSGSNRTTINHLFTPKSLINTPQALELMAS